jgi:hypothetical protein
MLFFLENGDSENDTEPNFSLLPALASLPRIAMLF